MGSPIKDIKVIFDKYVGMFRKKCNAYSSQIDNLVNEIETILEDEVNSL